MAAGGARLGVDTGGTFTDLVLAAGGGRIFTRKVASTPDMPERAIIEGIQAILADADLRPADLAELLHGTTVGSNALLQKRGARCGLITTRGFRDVLEIGRVRTPTMFDLGWEKPEPLISRRLRLEVDERTTATGQIAKPLDRDGLLEAGRLLETSGVQSVAICFLNSYANPHNEAVAAELLRTAFPRLAVTASVAILPEAGEYERCSTAAVNAYVLPVLRGYLERLLAALRDMGVVAPILMANSNGGLSSLATAMDRPVFFVSSGRSAGASGTARLADASGLPDLVAFDMGGTTASAALVHRGALSRTHEYEFRAGMSVPSRFIKAGGYMMRVPTVDVAEVGSGAGSIASVDDGGLLTVGPQSAGAEPGPACYGTGGVHPTVTDANVVLGLLPAELAGGTLRLDADAARRAVKRELADPLGISVEEAALGVRDVVNANMARAIRAVTVERGVDPRDFTLCAFGGSGPLHACDLAASIGIRAVLFPPAPGVFTAMGMLGGQIEHHLLRSFPGTLDLLDCARLALLVSEMREEARTFLTAEGHDESRLSCAFTLDLRFSGQDAALPVAIAAEDPCSDRIGEDFLAEYRSLYGYVSNDQVETVALRLRAEIAAERDGFPTRSGFDESSGRGETPEHSRLATLARMAAPQLIPVVNRSDLAGAKQGPLIIESADTTILIPPLWTVAAGQTHLIATPAERTDAG